jgi:hypothetical protein
MSHSHSHLRSLHFCVWSRVPSLSPALSLSLNNVRTYLRFQMGNGGHCRRHYAACRQRPYLCMFWAMGPRTTIHPPPRSLPRGSIDLKNPLVEFTNRGTEILALLFGMSCFPFCWQASSPVNPTLLIHWLSVGIWTTILDFSSLQ